MADAAPGNALRGARLEVEGDVLRLAGDLGLTSVGGVLEDGRAAIAAAPGRAVVLDLSGVDKSDSAGLALVVDWLRAARRRDLALSIRGAPAQLALIARVSGLDELIGGEEASAA